MSKIFPFVSIVIPIIGYKKILSYQCDSISVLDYPKDRLEILFVKLSSQRIRAVSLGIQTQFVNSQEIIGYSQAANLGVKKSKGEYIFLLNPDVQLDRYVLQKMIDCFFYHTRIAVVGPVVYERANPKKISSYDLPGINFHTQFGKMMSMTEKNITDLKVPYEVDWLSGCALLFSRQVWSELAGFEEKLFIYWEDADFCMRAKELGLKVLLVPGARVWHEGSVYMKSENLSKLYYLVRNGSYFLERHSRFLGRAVLHGNNLFLIVVKSIRFIFQPQRRKESSAFLLGVFDFYRGRFGRRVWVKK